MGNNGVKSLLLTILLFDTTIDVEASAQFIILKKDQNSQMESSFSHLFLLCHKERCLTILNNQIIL